MIILLIISLFFACIKCTTISSLKWGPYSPYNIFSMTKMEFLAPELSLFYYYCPGYRKCLFRQKVESSIDVKYLYNNGESYFLEKVRDDNFGVDLEIELSKKEFEKRQAWDATVSLLTSKNISLSFVFKLRNNEHTINIIEQERNNMIIFSFGGPTGDNQEFIKIEGEDTCHFHNISTTILKVPNRDLIDVTYNYISNKEIRKEAKNDIEDEDEDEEGYKDIFDEKKTEKETNKNDLNDANILYFDFSLDQACIFFISYDDSKVPEFDDLAFSDRKRDQKKSFRKKVFEKFMNNQIHLSPTDFGPKLDLSLQTISNLLGGLTYYHGNLSTINTKIKHGEKGVFCSTPSREKFPRGFLWDEGFHLTILCKWDQFLCSFIIENWLHLMDINGWIAREQIRNIENAQKVDPRFVSQDFFEANPPTLIFGILTLISETEKSLKNLGRKEQLLKKNTFVDYISTLYRKLKLWFVWMMDTQTDVNEKFDFDEKNLRSEFLSKHSKLSGTYDWKPKIRWHCKGECHDGNFMGSGLDDYPREDDDSKSEQHLDLAVWLCFFAENLEKIASYIDEHDDSTEYNSIFTHLKEKINEEFLDYTDFIYKDVTYNVKENEYDHNNHLGYINLFPFFFGLHQNRSEIKESFYRLLGDDSLLKSKFGIRSLSKLDFYFGKNDNYWRGPIWIPLNFLVLRSLKLYFEDDKKGRDLYYELKNDLEENLIAEWERTGFLWENYCSISGKGQREKGFTGWSALIVLIMNEDYWE